MTTQFTEKVLEVVASVAAIPREQISTDSTLQELGLDSLETMNLVFNLEEEFHISVPDSLTQVKSVRQLLEELEPLVEQPALAAEHESSR